LRQLRYFVRIVETGSMTKAAEHFRVAQTALGLQVRELERHIGGKILERHSRGVMPTRSGQLLFERAREILDLVDRTVVEVTQLQRKTAEVITFGFIPSQMQLLAHDLLLWARRELPTVLLRLIEEFRPHEAIRRGEVDFGIGCQVPEQPGLVRIPLLIEELIFVTAPDAASTHDLDDQALDRAHIDIKELLRHELAFSPHATEMWELVETAARAVSCVPRVAYEVQSIQAIKTLVANGDAASVLPYGSVRTELVEGRLLGRRLRAPGLRWTLYLCSPARRAPLLGEDHLSRLIEYAVGCLLEKLGPLATSMWTPERRRTG
jgi:LysR family transcriptional regulator, nitrogen assimilation regulatory protein